MKIFLQIIGSLLGIYLIYTGTRNIFSKKYSDKELKRNAKLSSQVHSVSDDEVSKQQKSNYIFFRYGLPINWVVIGVALLLFVYWSLGL